MFGFNWIDLIIVALLATLAYEGIKIGLLTQLFGIAGFFGTLFITSWLFPHLLPFRDQTLKAMLSTIFVLLASLYAGAKAGDLGQKVHWSFRLGKLMKDRKLKRAEMILGSLPIVFGGLALVWMLGVTIGRLPFAGFSNSVSDSQIVQLLTRTLPPAPAVFAKFSQQIDPNTLPYITAQPKPSADFNYSTDEVQSAADKIEPSVVRITSFGCGGLVSGSGVVIAKDLVATNAHVIAGVQRPIIKYQSDSYEGVAVFFDVSIDLAIMRVSNLPAPAGKLEDRAVDIGSTVAVLGYPGGNYTVSPGIVREQLSAESTNIYNVGSFDRNAYGLQTDAENGSSGGPVVNKDGRVVGMIFSKSATAQNYAYALNSSYLIKDLLKAKNSHQRVSTGACFAG
jgi:S1-C subfamily serine protease